MTIIINNQKFDLTGEQMNTLRQVLNFSGNPLSDVAIGDTFEVADIEFIHFGDSIAVTKDCTGFSGFGDTNNMKANCLLTQLQSRFLPQIISAVGEENVYEFETNLITFDGLRDYGLIQSKVSLPVLDFYRENADIFEKYNPGAPWWLATAYSTMKREFPKNVLCVTPTGYVSNNICGCRFGIRPILHFNPSIIVR